MAGSLIACAHRTYANECKWDRIDDTDVNAKLMLSTERDDGKVEGLFERKCVLAEAFLLGIQPELSQKLR